MKWLGILLVAVLLVSVPGYGSAQQQQGASPAAQSQGAVSAAERKAYEQETARELEAFQKKIGDMRAQAMSGSPQNKRLLIQAAKNLQMQQIGAAGELKALEKASGPDWGPQKVKVEKAMAGLRAAFEPTAPPRK